MKARTAQKVKNPAIVGFPLEKYEIELQWTRTYFITKLTFPAACRRLVGHFLPTKAEGEKREQVTDILVCQSNKAVWCTLKSGLRVCVNTANWKPFLWAKMGETKNNTEVFSVVSEDKDNNPYLAAN